MWQKGSVFMRVSVGVVHNGGMSSCDGRRSKVE